MSLYDMILYLPITGSKGLFQYDDALEHKLSSIQMWFAKVKVEVHTHLWDKLEH